LMSIACHVRSQSNMYVNESLSLLVVTVRFLLIPIRLVARRSPNQMERRMTVNHRIGDQALIKGGQLTSMRAGE
jgi:hypothetical protein